VCVFEIVFVRFYCFACFGRQQFWNSLNNYDIDGDADDDGDDGDDDDEDDGDNLLQLAKKYHPDVNRNDPEAQKKFQAASEAYEVRFAFSTLFHSCSMIVFYNIRVT